MSYHDYKRSQAIAGEPFYAIIMAAMRNADTDNLSVLKRYWPEVWDELQKRYNAPGGCLTYDEVKRYFPDQGITEEMFERIVQK